MPQQTLDLSKAVNAVLEEYGDTVEDSMQKVLKDVGQKAVSILKEKSPKMTGRYAKGWRADTEKLAFGSYEIVVHNKTDWNLTHLLNNGFYSVRKKMRIHGDGHIDSAEKAINEEFVKEIEGALK